MVKNPSARARVARDVGSIPRLGRCPGGGNGSHPPPPSILAWRIPRIEESQSVDHKGSDVTE